MHRDTEPGLPGLLLRPARSASREAEDTRGFRASSLYEDLLWQEALRSREEPQPWLQRAGVRVLSLHIHHNGHRAQNPGWSVQLGEESLVLTSPERDSLPVTGFPLAVEPEVSSRPGPPMHQAPDLEQTL